MICLQYKNIRLHRRSRFGAWTTALCMKSGTESLATFYGSLNLLLSAYSQEVLDLKAAWINCGGGSVLL